MLDCNYISVTMPNIDIIYSIIKQAEILNNLIVYYEKDEAILHNEITMISR